MPPKNELENTHAHLIKIVSVNALPLSPRRHVALGLRCSAISLLAHNWGRLPIAGGPFNC